MGLDQTNRLESAQVVHANVAIAIASGQVLTARADFQAASAKFELLLLLLLRRVGVECVARV